MVPAKLGGSVFITVKFCDNRLSGLSVMGVIFLVGFPPFVQVSVIFFFHMCGYLVGYEGLR